MDRAKMKIVNEFKSLLNEVKAEVDIIEKASKYVIVYKIEKDLNDDNDSSKETTYGVTKTDINMLSEVYNILPYPSLKDIEIMDKEQAKIYAFRHRFIKNGFGSIYQSRIMTYADYAKIFYENMTKSYQSVISMAK